MTIRALIVEDERLARRDLAVQLAPFPEVEIVGEADSVARAKRLCDELSPTLLFLDIELPDGSGFDVAAHASADTRIIFVTAYDRFAVRAFQVNALDYLLKPVDSTRLRETLARVPKPANDAALPELLANDVFCAIDGTERGFVAVRAIRRLRAHGNYTEIFTTDDRAFEVKQSLQEWERRLPADVFARVNRNDLVQVSLITQLLPTSSGGYVLYLTGDTEPLAVSRRALPSLRERLRVTLARPSY